MTGKKSDDPLAPNYIPIIFPQVKHLRSENWRVVQRREVTINALAVQQALPSREKNPEAERELLEKMRFPTIMMMVVLLHLIIITMIWYL